MFSTTLYPLTLTDVLVRTSPLSLVLPYSNERLGLVAAFLGKKAVDLGLSLVGWRFWVFMKWHIQAEVYLVAGKSAHENVCGFCIGGGWGRIDLPFCWGKHNRNMMGNQGHGEPSHNSLHLRKNGDSSWFSSQQIVGCPVVWPFYATVILVITLHTSPLSRVKITLSYWQFWGGKKIQGVLFSPVDWLFFLPKSCISQNVSTQLKSFLLRAP